MRVAQSSRSLLFGRKCAFAAAVFTRMSRKHEKERLEQELAEFSTNTKKFEEKFQRGSCGAAVKLCWSLLSR